MKKIIGILLALSLVLSLAVMAAPVAAKVSAVAVTVTDTNCACSVGTYTISFNITASLTQGVHCVCITFPAGTTVPTTYKDGDITIEGDSVFGSEVTVDGNTVCFLPPATYTVAANEEINVVFTKDAGIINPCTPGKTYQLEVYTCREPDSTPVKSNKYTILPCICEFEFVWDSGPTYPGIAEGFVPPFKACGQNVSNNQTIASAVNIGNASHPKFMNAFNLTFMADPGCNPPCLGNVTLKMSLVAAPQFPCEADPTAYATINLTGPCGGVNMTKLSFNECVDDEPEELVIGSIYQPACNDTCVFEGLIHFDTVGEYTICFWAECPGAVGAPCQPPAGGDAQKFAETCLDFKVYQWKDAEVEYLREKWNLISLPLVPLVEGMSVEDALASIPAADLANILSIWYYDRCADEWLVWAADGSQSSLTTLEDGKGYWVRVAYPLPGCGNITWWKWGTYLPVPPASPAEYPVCEGWNMIGLTGWFTQSPSGYLWNWPTIHPVVYKWVPGCWTTQGWSLIPWATVGMNMGEGFWIAFPADGAVYVP